MQDAHWSTFFIFLGAVFLTATGGAIFKPGAWYDRLDKPGWTPPNWAFPVVWGALYVMIAFAGWRLWTIADPAARPLLMGLYGLQLILNFAWSAVFFGLRRMGAAFLEVSALWLSVAALLIAAAPVDALSAGLLAPYLLWVTIAAALNLSVWRRNAPRKAA